MSNIHHYSLHFISQSFYIKTTQLAKKPQFRSALHWKKSLCPTKTLIVS